MSEVKYVGLEAAEALIQETQNRLNDKSPINHSHNLSSTSASGFLRQLNGNISNFLRGDGTWATPPDTNTTYSTGNSSTPGITKLYTGTGTNTDGTMTQNAITSALSGKASSDHDHSASDITSGILSVSRGGTGVTSNPSMLVNLSSTSTANVFATSPRPGVTGTLPITNGGTGATSASAARSALGITPANIGAATSGHTHNAFTGASGSGSGTAGFVPAPSQPDTFLCGNGMWVEIATDQDIDDLFGIVDGEWPEIGFE